MNALSKVILPREVTSFEASYIGRINHIAFLFFLTHIPVFMGVAYLNNTGVFDALWLTLLAMVGPGLGHRVLSSPRTLSLVYGFTSMIMGALLVHFGQGPVQIEMHFYFFALLAMLAVYGNPMVIVVAAVTVALHHLLFWMYLPKSVFNYDAPLWVVLVHAAFVVLESVATCSIARSFFDNVIGLERIVRERTSELRLVLDNVDQGFLTINAEGVMAVERSAVVDTWFGEPAPQMKFHDLLERLSPDVALAFEMGFDQVVDGFLPLELALEQLPGTLKLGDRTLSISYTPITADGELERLLIVISDVSAVIERERLEAEQREVMRLFERIMADKSGFLEFFGEAASLVDDVVQDTISDLPTLKRVVHTIKGNCMLFGIHSVAEHCHSIETRMLEEEGPPTDQEREELAGLWTKLRHNMETFLGDRVQRSMEIQDEEYETLLLALVGDVPREELAQRVAMWRLEPTELRLERLKLQAASIAERLGKPAPKVEIVDNHLRLDPERWAPFWAAFVHVVRNALDHGIEDAQERESRGKDTSGTLRLITQVEGERFFIKLQDDGRGINWQAVEAKARSLGLATETREQLVEALFSDGLSTADQVTQFSGRGVGMGAIAAATRELSGKVQVESAAELGTNLSFSFPVSMMADDILEKLQSEAA